MLVIVYDATKNEYTISSHNLEPAQAAHIIEERQLQLEPECSFMPLDQRGRHNTPDVQNCRACRDQVRRSSGLQPPPKFRRRKQ